MTTLFDIFIFLFGAIWGSFFYTLALRYANGSMKEDPKKALFSSSQCPDCGKRINPIFLFPVLGFFFTRGRCGSCRSQISAYYPAAEMIYGVILLALVRNNPTPLTNLSTPMILYIFSSFLLVGLALSIAVIDIKTFTIPNSLILVFLLLSIYPIIVDYSFMNNLYGFLFMSIFFILGLLIFPGGIGGGDATFAAAIGLLVGLEFSIVVLESALITGSFSGITYALVTRKGLKIKFPFGPFLALGLLITLLYGRELVLLYSEWFLN
ncbi:MAG: prepilin peptidase [bacterium]|nr:prepilin peptidase [bacterium]